MSLVELGTFLGIPSKGVRIVRGFAPDTPGWEYYNKMNYFFIIFRISQLEFYARQARSSSTKLFVLHREPSKKMGKTSIVTIRNCLKNMEIFKDVDGIFKHTDVENVYTLRLAPEDGYTMEFLYKKLHEMDLRHSSELSVIRDDLNFIKH
ncbi:unnamed protein product [Vicia faba]|uniref:Uncharacterized protein n=1 Tax=Vicia faba TaxID=3906 RepID=A0AAV1AQS4_VICFA|nr:unnamed protein product [Vicia faba]